MRVVAIQHLSFEDLGSFAQFFEGQGDQIEMKDATRDDLHPARDADLLIVLGGPISANDSARFPFLTDECHLLEHRISLGLPTIGVCLGAQLIAQVLGAKVYPMGLKEIGFSALAFTEAGRAHPLAKISAPVLHWHGETFDLPENATRLASTALCAEQAFAYGDHTLALQFHLEVRSQELERWLVGHIVELETAGVDLSGLRADSAKWSALLEAEAGNMLKDWLASLPAESLKSQ